MHHLDPLVISAGLPANTGVFLIAKVYSYNCNTHFTSKVLRFISAKLFHQGSFDGLQHRRISHIKSPDSGKTESGVINYGIFPR